jgi:O-antigen/teichoic acid export membrane protein
MKVRTKSTFLAAADQAVVSLGNFIGIALIARILGVNEFGTFAVIWITLNLLQILIGPILIAPQINIQRTLQGQELNEFRATLHHLSILLALSSAVITAISIEITNAIAVSSFQVGDKLKIFTAILISVYAEYLRRRSYVYQETAKALRQDIARYAALIMVSVLATVQQKTHVASDGFLFISTANAISILFGVQLNDIGRSRLDYIRLLGRHHAKFILRLTVERILAFAGNNIQFLVLAIISGGQSIGGLKAIHNITRSMNLLTQLAENTLPPRLSAEISEGKSIKRTTLKYILGLTAGQIILSTAIIIYGEGIILMLYGSEFLNYADTLPLFAAFFVISSGVTALRSYFQVIGNSTLLLQSQVFALCVGILSLTLLIGKLGPIAVPFSMILYIATLCAALTVAFFTSKKLTP